MLNGNKKVPAWFYVLDIPLIIIKRKQLYTCTSNAGSRWHSPDYTNKCLSSISCMKIDYCTINSNLRFFGPCVSCSLANLDTIIFERRVPECSLVLHKIDFPHLSGCFRSGFMSQSSQQKRQCSLNLNYFTFECLLRFWVVSTDLVLTLWADSFK